MRRPYAGSTPSPPSPALRAGEGEEDDVLRYFLKRLLAAIPTLIAVLTVVFLLVRVVPGDPAQTILGDQATAQALAALRVRLGLDRPLYVQYFEFVFAALRGDLGNSL